MSEFLTHFHFLRPAWLLLILPTVILGWLLLRRHSHTLQWDQIIAPHLLPHLIDGQTGPVQRSPMLMLIGIWLLASVALAGPTWEKLPQPLHREASALVIAWDLSPSMSAQDIKPSRLVRSRLKLIDLLRKRDEGLTALIAYSGEAHVVTPLTDDTKTIISLIHGLDPKIMPAKGSNTEMALTLANRLLKDGGVAHGDILFLTDGISKDAHNELVQINNTTGHAVSLWGIGTSEGAPIPLNNGGFAYDRNGDMVIAKLNDAELSDIAVELGGIYVPFTQSELDLDIIQNFVVKTELNKVEQSTRELDQWYEYGPYLLLILLPFAALAFRKGLLVVILIGAFVLPMEEANALEWQNIWKNSNQQAAELLDKTPDKAAEKFSNEEWKAIANYRAGAFDKALEGFTGETADNYYNRGNALTQLGKYDDAVTQFQAALEKEPSYEKAKNNLKIAQQLKILEQQQQQQNQQQGDNSDQQEGEQNSDNSDQNPSEDSSDKQQQDGKQTGENNQQSNAQQQQNDTDSQPENSDEGTPSEQQQALNEQQKAALEQAYGEKQNEHQQPPEGNSEKERQEELQASLQQKNGEDPNEQQPESDQPLIAAQQPMSKEDREQQEAQQSLQQWLRKVPDDPSGLLRNKFKYEHNQRIREFQQQPRHVPGSSSNDQRW